jgi:hypothetical protein
VGGLGVAGAAADARNTAGAAGNSTRTGELPAGATTDAWDAALPARTAARTGELPAGPTVAVGIAATAARVLLVSDVGRCNTRGATEGGLSCRHRHYSNRRSNSPTNEERFHETECFCHADLLPTSTHVQNIHFLIY